MKLLSMKAKLTIWITMLMLFLVSVVFVIMLSFTSRIVTNNTSSLLLNTIRNNLTSISKKDGKLVFDENFSFTYNGVYTLVYSESGALLAGQPPLSFPEKVNFINGRIYDVDSKAGEYYVIDYLLHFNWNDKVWVRSIVQRPDVVDLVEDMKIVALVLLPMMIVIAAIGAYMLASSTFKPIDKIIDAAKRIDQGSDLSLRIGLPKSYDEIGKLSQAFDKMFERLEKSFESEKQFTSDASHELRTPIAVILAQCSEAKQGYDDIDKYKQAIEVIDRQAERISVLIKQLLQMARLEQGTQIVNFEVHDLSEFLEIICLEQQNIPDTMELKFDIQKDIIAQFDIVLMSRLVQNLIDNAIKYGDKNGYIKIKLWKQLNIIYLSIEDNGIGISKDKIDSIWKRFYQADNSRNKQNGAGLGLTMVKQIANLHKGEISVNSVLGEGTCFLFCFPQSQN